MNWTIVYAVAITFLAIWCAIGWKLAHDSLVALADVDDKDWPTVRGILRLKVLKRADGDQERK